MWLRALYFGLAFRLFKSACKAKPDDGRKVIVFEALKQF